MNLQQRSYHTRPARVSPWPIVGGILAVLVWLAVIAMAAAQLQ